MPTYLKRLAEYNTWARVYGDEWPEDWAGAGRTRTPPDG
jgi:hypothetical protein